jgi:Bacterial TniB protein
LLACTPRKQRAALNVVKFLSNELRVSIIALGTSEALHVMRTDPQIASRFESCTLPSWTANEQLRSFVAGFLKQIEIKSGDLVNSKVAMDYLLELTSGVTGRIVELLRLGARCALRRDSRILSIECLQDAGKEFAGDLGSERSVSNLCHFPLIVSVTELLCFTFIRGVVQKLLRHGLAQLPPWPFPIAPH